MAYTKTNWQDLPSTATPLNATNLNKIENELEAVDKSLKYMGNAPVDLNEARTFGLYKLGGNFTNGPIELLYGILVVYESNGTTWVPGGNNSSSWIWQEIRSTSGDIYVRGAVNTADSWSDWKQINKGDTGWVDMSSYVNTDYFSARPNMRPEARRIGNIVYWRGEVYCKTRVTYTNAIEILSNIPDQFTPSYQFSGGGCRFMTSDVYNIYIDGSKDIKVNNNDKAFSIMDNICGFQLSNISGYPID